MGAPAELYENPQTTFVANFLGQSNLIRAESSTGRGDQPRRRRHGTKVAVPRAARARATTGDVLGRRPPREDLHVGRSATEHDSAANTLTGGVVSDVSFVGVSTQYLVAHALGPGADGLRAEQRARATCSRTATAVDLHWSRRPRVPARRGTGRARRCRAGGRLMATRRGRARPPTPAASVVGSAAERRGSRRLAAAAARHALAGALLRLPADSSCSPPPSTTRAASSRPATR